MTKKKIPKIARGGFKELFNEGLENKILMLTVTIIVIPLWVVIGVIGFLYFDVLEEYLLYLGILAFCLPMIIIFSGATIIALKRR